MPKISKCKYITNYISKIEKGTLPASKEIKQATKLVKKKLKEPDVYIDNKKVDKAIELMERYFEITLIDWQLFVLALVHAFYKTDNTPVYNKFLIMMGRGNGKNGFISPLTWYLTTHYHGIKEYDVDIIANSEAQARTSFDDIYNVLDLTWNQSQNFFTKKQTEIVNTKTNSYIKYNTSNARTKDGKRSACLIFDEIHEYESYDTIKVFTSGFGKKPHSRTFMITTNGYVREGVLDNELAIAKDILKGAITDLRTLPLLYKLDDKKEADNPDMWIKANPSIEAFPLLKREIEEVNIERKYNDEINIDFLTKRMNLPSVDKELVVTDWANIKATNKELPDLAGENCTIGIDYATVSDFVSVNLHFREGEKRYDINHSWFCSESADKNRIKAPLETWAAEGLLTIVDDVEIHPELITEYIFKMTSKYNVTGLAVDNHRYALLTRYLEDIGFYKEDIKLVRPSDIMQVIPVIESVFNNNNFVWGDNPVLRWATNNTKKKRRGKRAGTDTGNYYYAKQEGRSRKTDPYMALVHSMVIEDQLPEVNLKSMPKIGIITI